MKKKLNSLINKIPNGYSKGIFNNSIYSLTKNKYNNGKSYKIFARELKGKDFISFNFYLSKNKEVLKPCEMSENKVIHFMENVKILKS